LVCFTGLQDFSGLTGFYFVLPANPVNPVDFKGFIYFTGFQD
jgi:hypothetical protein